MLVVSDSPADGVDCHSSRDVRRFLGDEFDLVIYDGHAGLHPDALAAAAGGIVGGGVLWLLMPPVGHWDTFFDPDKRRLAHYPVPAEQVGNRFLARLQTHIQHVPWQIVEADCGTAPVVTPVADADRDKSPTPGQQEVMRAVGSVINGHARRPLVVTSDRGRGKSTALGWALAAQMAAGPFDGLLIAPSSAAVETLLNAALATNPLLERHGNGLRSARGVLRFALPQDCLQTISDVSVVLIDEAASLSLGLLHTLLKRHNRVVLATTVHGYEGTGRGFTVRLGTLLDQQFRQWRAIELDEPVRWAAGDPLEAWFNRFLLMDAEPSPVRAGSAEDGTISYQQLDQATLLADESLLNEIVGLLSVAHYQTRPSDLRQLLDGVAVRLWIARRGQRLLGILWAVAEGGFSTEMAQAIWRGERRPHGHLLAQSLAAHGGFVEGPQLRLLRVQRIAVAADQRGKGIGRALLRCAGVAVDGDDFALLGTSYGLRPDLLEFWSRCGFQAVRLGARRDPASGAHTIQMLRGISAEGRHFTDQAAGVFLTGLPWQLGDSLQLLDWQVVPMLLRGRGVADLDMTVAARDALVAFAHHHRMPEDCSHPLWLCVVMALATGAADRLDEAQLQSLISRVLQHHSDERVVRDVGLGGRRELVQIMRNAVGSLIAELTGA